MHLAVFNYISIYDITVLLLKSFFIRGCREESSRTGPTQQDTSHSAVSLTAKNARDFMLLPPNQFPLVSEDCFSTAVWLSRGSPDVLTHSGCNTVTYVRSDSSRFSDESHGDLDE